MKFNLSFICWSSEIAFLFSSNLCIILSRIAELSSLNERLKSQLAEKKENLCNIKADQLSCSSISTKQRQDIDPIQTDHTEMESIHGTIRNIAIGVLEDSELTLSTNDVSRSPARFPFSVDNRRVGGSSSRSPEHREDSTLALIQSALQMRHQQLLEMRTKLIAVTEEKLTLAKQVTDTEYEKKKMEERISSLKADLKNTLVRSSYQI